MVSRYYYLLPKRKAIYEKQHDEKLMTLPFISIIFLFLLIH